MAPSTVVKTELRIAAVLFASLRGVTRSPGELFLSCDSGRRGINLPHETAKGLPRRSVCRLLRLWISGMPDARVATTLTQERRCPGVSTVLVMVAEQWFQVIFSTRMLWAFMSVSATLVDRTHRYSGQARGREAVRHQRRVNLKGRPA